ncbi:MAG: glycoside hydrolase family 2 TIM barrel-domain containing protein [Crocinitomicaceae bacterium]
MINQFVRFFGAFYLLFFFVFSAQAQSRTKVNFGKEWTFSMNSMDWEKVNLPHSVRMENKVIAQQFQGVSYYKKTFHLKPKKNAKTSIYFEGVMLEAKVTLNGKILKTHLGGYLPFSVDISDALSRSGKNELLVEVKNEDNLQVPPGKPLSTLDFNYFGGIYRNVYLITTQKVHITDEIEANKVASGGIYVVWNAVESLKASGNIQVHIANESKKGQTIHFKATLNNAKGGSAVIHSDTKILEAGTAMELKQDFYLDNPLLWSPESPNLYGLSLELYANNKLVDCKEIKIGARKSEIRADGYYLNNEKRYISGTNRHQEYPYVGNTISDEAQRRDAVKIKEAGFDFVRLSHYPQAEAFLNACDELGILVMNCIPGWQYFGDATFQENSYQTLREMVRRDRNHASIVFWENSLNESEMSTPFMVKMNAVLQQELAHSNAFSCGWMDHPSYSFYIPARQHGKAPNYWNDYAKGDRKVFIAEYGDWEYYAQNAGFSQKEFANLKEEERTSRQLRAAGEKRLLQQAFNYQEAANSNRKGKNTMGEANWLMFDYTRGYSPDIESSGISDIFRIPKFAFYFYQSQRAVISLKPEDYTLEIASYWNENSPKVVTVFSNCDEVGLYLNNQLVTTKSVERNKDNDQLNHPPFLFELEKFVPGELKAVGKVNGMEIKTAIVRTAGSAAKIGLEYDLSSVEISKENPDIVFVYAKILDENGTLVTNSNALVTFELDGKNAALIGENPVQAEAGIATILLRTEDLKHPLTIKAMGAGLTPQSLNIH